MFAHSAHVMTLANSIIGVGILAMPFCFEKCGIVLATLLLIASNWVTRVCCHYLIKCSLLTRRKSFEFLGFHAFGTSGKLLVELCIIGYLLGTCITYFVVVGDLGPQIVTKILSLSSPHFQLRTWVMIAVTVVCILPLGMLKNVDSLSTVCTASIGFYLCLVVKIVLESEQHVVANDWIEKVKYWQPSGILQCLPIFSMALSCQMQLFEVFESINNQSVDKLNGIVKHATWICTFVYIAVGFFGYVAFCTQSFSGNILINLSESFGSDVIKMGFVLSVAFSFPLVIFPCRASIYSLLYRKGYADASGYIPESRFKAITIFIVTFALCIALMIPSVELIIGLVGSTIGVAICIMFPACCYRMIVKKDSTERILAHIILVSGFCLMILGTFANLNAIDARRSGPHLDVPAAESIAKNPLTLSTKEWKLEAKQEVSDNLSQTLEKDPSKLQQNLEKFVDVLETKNQKELDSLAKANITVKITSPPLPSVDVRHETFEEVRLEDPKHQQPPKLIPKDIPKSNKEEAIDKTAQSVSVKSASSDNLLVINSDAIHKEEEIVAEEQRHKESQSANDELKKTQNELKKTKELLRRTVGELKQELAKQNEETQNLVVEKLDEVVEKVRQIEQHVKKKESEHATDAQKSNIESREHAVLKTSVSAPTAPEPSHKSDVLNDKVRNLTKLEQQLSIPLPLLINASSLDTQANVLPLEKHFVTADILNNNVSQRKEIKGMQIKLDKSGAAIEKESSNDDKEKEILTEKKSSIQRDLLQFEPKLNDNSITAGLPSLPAAEQNQKERVKRSSSTVDDGLNFNAIQSRFEQEHSLPSLNIDTLAAAVGSRNIDFKIGRDLKAVEEDVTNYHRSRK